jgi:F-type H+-transporting ATPase subunit alpha
MQTTLNPSEISELIKKRVQELDISAETRNEGTVVSVSDGIARLHGLEDAMQGEMIEFPGNTYGLALNLERDSVGTVILGNYEHITEGDTVKCTGRILEVPQGRGLLGRVVDALGNPIDGQGPIENDGYAPIEKVAPGVIWRKSVDQPVQTGLKSIDAMVPIGRGQRELIIGDRHRHDHQPGRYGHQVRVRGGRAEAVHGIQRGTQARRTRRDGAHHRGQRIGFGIGGHAVHRPVFRLHDG